MSDSNTKWLVALLMVFLVGIVFRMFPSIPKIDLAKHDLNANKEVVDTAEKTKTATSSPEAGWNTYKNTEYGFEIRYPQEILPEGTFKKFYHLSDGWRVGNLAESSGTPLVAFPIYRIENENSYPKYYDAEVRIGVSLDPNDVAHCTSSGPYGAASSTEVIINGAVFYVFPIQDAGMMQYLEGKSFRSVHHNTCFAVEQIRTGSNYRNTTSSTEDVDEILRGYFDKGWNIIATFKFLN